MPSTCHGACNVHIQPTDGHARLRRLNTLPCSHVPYHRCLATCDPVLDTGFSHPFCTLIILSAAATSPCGSSTRSLVAALMRLLLVAGTTSHLPNSAPDLPLDSSGGPLRAPGAAQCMRCCQAASHRKGLASPTLQEPEHCSRALRHSTMRCASCSHPHGATAPTALVITLTAPQATHTHVHAWPRMATRTPPHACLRMATHGHAHASTRMSTHGHAHASHSAIRSHHTLRTLRMHVAPGAPHSGLHTQHRQRAAGA